MTAGRKYAATQNETASRERLMVLLLEAALRHTRVAAIALEQRRKKDATAPLQKASEIVAELMSTLDRARAPELVDRLAELYGFVAARLLLAAASFDPLPAREAERVLLPIVEGFNGAVAKMEQASTPEAAR